MFPKLKTYSSSWILPTFGIYLTDIHKDVSKHTWKKKICLKPYLDDQQWDFFFPQGLSSNIVIFIHNNILFLLSTSLQK